MLEAVLFAGLAGGGPSESGTKVSVDESLVIPRTVLSKMSNLEVEFALRGA